MNINKSQIAIIAILRLLIGWHLLYEGIFKLLHPEWSSLGFLAASQGFMSGFATWIISNDNILNIVDTLNTWGLMAIGLGLILGLFTRIAAWTGAGLLLLYYFMNPPFISASATAINEGNYLLVNKTLIEACALVLLAFFKAGQFYGLDLLINTSKK